MAQDGQQGFRKERQALRFIEYLLCSKHIGALMLCVSELNLILALESGCPDSILQMRTLRLKELPCL